MNDNFFTAEEAKQKSLAVLSSKLENELDFIYKEINEAISQGSIECKFYSKKFSNEATNFLESKGFKVNVTKGDPRELEYDTTVYWD